MSYHPDLEEVITDAVNDSQIAETETPVDTSSDDTGGVELATEPVEDVAADTEAPADDLAVSSPAAAGNAPADPAKPKDDFESLVGMPQNGVGGRENRIPYSRVKKITEKAVGEVVEAVTGRKLNPGERPLDVVKSHLSKFAEMETQFKDYESRLENVGRFEDVMANQPEEFLRRLSTLPQYQGFFQAVEQALSGQPQGQAIPQPTNQAAFQQPQVVGDEMPQPDEELPDGTKVYSMEGLQNLLAWRDKQVESRVTKQIEERYKPIESEWQERRRIEATLPIVRAKIEEAKTWPLFNESEEEITAALEANPNLSLDGAYRMVVFPKLIAERNKMRQDVLTEVSRAPVATSIASKATKPVAPATGPRSIEDIIAGEVAKIKRT